MLDASKFVLIVTSGPTREWFDPVRFISNPASGQTGWQIARIGLERFSRVIYIAGPGHPSFRQVEGAVNLSVETTEEMANTVYANLGPNTLLFMTAAPADYKPEKPSSSKIKKENKDHLDIHLIPTQDILLGMKDLTYENFYRIGFAAETDNIISNAAEKMNRKKLDFICANAVHKNQKGFGDNENVLTVIDKNHELHEIGPFPKDKLALHLLDFIMSHIR